MFEQITDMRPLLLVGCGNMGRALLSGWISRGLSRRAIWIIEPNSAAGLLQDVAEGQVVKAASDLPEGLDPRVVVLAVKPQVMPLVLPDLKSFGRDDTLFLSIAAGVRSETISAELGPGSLIIRAMPNTPAFVGKGISAIVRSADAGAEGLAVVAELLAAAGEIVWVETEKDLDAVTAVSGSGPAYVFHLVEAMAAAGVELGLEEGLAGQLARQTIIGAGALLEESEASPAALRVKVTSPKGTTEAALQILMQEPGGLSELMTKAIASAAARAEELSKQ